jgi:hypothetical protein
MATSLACQGKTSVSETEWELMRTVRTRLVALLEHLREVHPHDVKAKTLVRILSKLRLGISALGVPEYDAEHGCMLIPYDEREPVVLGKVLLALSRAVSGNASCAADTHSFVLRVASEHLEWPVALGCDACLSRGVCFRAACPKCMWLDNAPDRCHARRYAWPELIGQPVTRAAEILRRQNPGVRIKVVPWDTLYLDPSAPGDIRVVYDARTGRVSPPAPHLTTLPEPGQPRETCFLPGEGACLGAPRPPPPKSWNVLLDKKLDPALRALRKEYPEAAIDVLPRSARVSEDLRHDRIRVWIDPQSARVSGWPSIG